MTFSLVTIHPFDPWGSKIGGIETAIRTLFQHAPDDCVLSLAGVTENPHERPPGRWIDWDYQGREIRFLPIFPVEQPNRRTVLPLFLRFPLQMRFHRLDFKESIVLYHRIEPLVFAAIPSRASALCVHGDPREIVGPDSEVRWRFLPGLYRWLEARAVRKARRLFVVSRSGIEYFHHTYPQKTGEVFFLSTFYRDEIFFPIDSSERIKIRNRFLQRLNLPGDSRLVLFAGRWEAQKDPLLALRTFAVLSARHRDIHLLLAGSGYLQARMEESVKSLHLQNRVHWLGSLSPSELAEILHASDVFLLTSQFEGMPIGVLEALACGLPVVATDTGEIKTVVRDGETGRIAGDRNTLTLTAALLDILQNPDRYPRERCSQSVHSYRPDSVLPSFFEGLRSLIEST